ncbi:hypothetical protein C8A00DRAFT_31521 [Chaetomidium leptoderma]|uniref:Rhodopsin domain-containing protein n=1 Tax=Chaetomidium leptoderma TaxID=669021 RepID=A0AAN6ZZ93_9PEZI|nr:hypothetical protein C8A00DRAFT_31521 [Chaetomidium leptoderma]
MSSADGTIMGAAPPPPGMMADFENPESISYRLIIVSVVFPFFALCFLLPRLYSAAFILKKWHPDDYLICVGLAFALANSIVCITQSTMGMGKHIWDLDFETYKETMKLGMIGGSMSYNLCTLFVKLSILSFYLRFSVDRAFRMAVYAVMFITVGYTIPNAFLFLYICKPIAFYWDWTIANGTCLSAQTIFDSANILNMSTDFMILLLPIWMLRPLRAPLLKKIGVALILMAGGFVCGISTMRMVTAMKGAYNPDITWHYPINLIWCLVEEYVGIICACLPCLKAFSRRFFPNSFLFSPVFEQRVSSSFPFSSLRLDTVASTTANANNANSSSTNTNNNNSDSDDVGGRKAWWKLRKGATATAAAAAAATAGAGSGTAGGGEVGDEEIKSKGGSTGKPSVDGSGSGINGDVEAARVEVAERFEDHETFEKAPVMEKGR